jgi:hypothetical protein
LVLFITKLLFYLIKSQRIQLEVILFFVGFELGELFEVWGELFLFLLGELGEQVSDRGVKALDVFYLVVDVGLEVRELFVLPALFQELDVLLQLFLGLFRDFMLLA